MKLIPLDKQSIKEQKKYHARRRRDRNGWSHRSCQEQKGL